MKLMNKPSILAKSARKVFVLSLLFLSLLLLALFSPTAVIASEPPEPPDSLDSSGIAITVVVPRPDVREAQLLPLQTTPQPEVHHIYPVHVWESREDGRREIIRVYELRDDECPSQIPRHPFERDGFRFEIAEIVRREIPAHSLREHTEIVTVSTQTNDLTSVIRLLSPTLEYLSDDGYFGILALDVTSIQIESQGTTSSSFTATQTREFPHLSSTDTSLVPRAITHGGRTYNLSNVEWRTQTSTAIDYRQVASTFTAVATYSRVGTRVATIGYTTTAEYRGQVSRIAVGRTEFTAHFIGIPIVTPVAPVTPVVTAPQPTQSTEAEPSEPVSTPTLAPELTPTLAPEPTPTLPTVVTVDQVIVGGIVIEVEKDTPSTQEDDYSDAVGSATDDDGDDSEDDTIAAEYDDGGFPFGTIAIVLLFAGGLVFAYFVGRKGKVMLAGTKKASCFLLALIIASGLLLGASQTVYARPSARPAHEVNERAAELPPYGFGRQNTQNTQGTQNAVHFNEISQNPQTSGGTSRQSTDAVMHFNPSVAASNGGASARASPAGHFSLGSGSTYGYNGYNYGDRIGTLTVERLNRTVNVIAGATMDAMDFGAGHFSFSGLNQGNTVLIGHNRGARNGFFSFVRLLQEGDIITLEAGGIVRSYAVAMAYYVDDSDFSPLMQSGDTRLTLVTCREYHRTQRRIAVAFAVD